MPARPSNLTQLFIAGCISVLITALLGYLERILFLEELRTLVEWLYGGEWGHDRTFALIFICVFGVPLYIVAVAVFALVCRMYGLSFQIADPSQEMRCRCCNAILRGLTEPRCPICREPI